MSRGGAPSEQQKKIDEMLRSARVLEQQVQRTSHHETIVFSGCNLEVTVVVDSPETRKVEQYRFVIHDPHENKTYIFNFGMDLMVELNKWVNAAPNVGEIADAE